MLSDYRNLASFINEIDSMRGLNHPNIIKFYEMLEDENHVYLVLDYCPELDLFQRILNNSTIEEKQAQEFAKIALQMLCYLHQEAKVIHRDLKPENILLLSKDNINQFKLADFGLATRFEDEDLCVRCGSPGYVAPEILNSMKYGSKADIYSLGITLFIMLAGKAPFQGNTVIELLKKNQQSNIIFHKKQFKYISQEAVDFIQKLTKSDPQMRPYA